MSSDQLTRSVCIHHKSADIASHPHCVVRDSEFYVLPRRRVVTISLGPQVVWGNVGDEVKQTLLGLDKKMVSVYGVYGVGVWVGRVGVAVGGCITLHFAYFPGHPVLVSASCLGVGGTCAP